ncbi:exo-alpha-sialidase [Thalassoroseus pseudoceratinae]|uniref:exo-alpha-sialidase n=1 Tax=Thalassoroseus pseudoceratinae TaxID=2713176 RepID=UPI001F0CFF9C|nr:exo-alpha-sialidase [Thalassoroseus pseudoceratinae]
MKILIVVLLTLVLQTSTAFTAEPKQKHLRPSRMFPMDSTNSEELQSIGGAAVEAAGVHGQSLVLSGRLLLAVKDPLPLLHSQKPFSLVVWFNPYHLERGQQMIATKNRYSLNEREWSVMIDRDQKLRLYVRQDGWKTTHASETLKPGHWHQVVVTIGRDRAQLWLNGKHAGSIALKRPIPQTNAPLTFGGVDDNGHIRQTFLGAIDHALLFDHQLTPSEIATLYHPVKVTHILPEFAKPFPLWDVTRPLPKANEIADLKSVEFQVIKEWNLNKDGYRFLHGVGLCWHQGKLYASIGHNRGAENTVTEEAQYRVSDDNGRSWSELRVIDAGDEPNLAVSHGVFLSHRGKLWAFHGAYTNKMEQIHTRAYTLGEDSGEWTKHGVVIRNGFWPMNQPVRMPNGNWIMPGFSGGRYSNDRVFLAAVAISHGDDLTQWDYVEIPASRHIARMWGESALYLDGKRVVNIARYGEEAKALVAISEDYGRTWTDSRVSNLPMATSKPAAGTLSNGQHYLVCTTAKDNGGQRTPLTITVTAPGNSLFQKVFVIRRSRLEGQPGESADHLSLSYPYAVEHDGHLYVGYSNNGGRSGNLNSAELAIIPIEQLKLPTGR